MKRRKFIKKIGLTAAATAVSPYILPSGRLFAPTGARVANHVVFVLFGGGIRNQEAVHQTYTSEQNGSNTSGNIMPNMLSGAVPTNNLIHTPWTPILNNSLQSQGTLFRELRYTQGPTGHYNGHTVAMTGNYTNTGLNLNINPENPTVFEYYRKHSDPIHSAIKAWWLSEGLGPYPSLNYSRHPLYGSQYGANYLRASSTITGVGQQYLNAATVFQPDDAQKIDELLNFMNANFQQNSEEIKSIINSRTDKEAIKKLYTEIAQGTEPFDFPLPMGISPNQLTGDLINIAAAAKIIEEFSPELLVVNTFNTDIGHNDFSLSMDTLHKADFGVGWLWDKIQSHPTMANDTIMICMPEHGRNLQFNNLIDSNGFAALDHTSDDNSREIFALVVGPPSKIHQNKVVGTTANPVGESIDIVPTIAHILGFKDDIPGGMLGGRVLTEAFI